MRTELETLDEFDAAAATGSLRGHVLQSLDLTDRLGILATVIFAIAAAILTWPAFFRLERTFPIAQIVSFRGLLAVAFAVIGWCTLHGLPGSTPSATGARGPRILGSVTPGAGPLRLPAPRERLTSIRCRRPA